MPESSLDPSLKPDASSEIGDPVYPTAGLLRRLAAITYDALLILALWFVVGFVGLAINGGEIIDGFRRLLLLFACLVTTFLFFHKFWRDGGQTAGMRAWRMKIVDEQEPSRRVTSLQCLLRFLTAIASIGLAGIGLLWILIDRDKLSWHDRYSGTRFVVLPKRKKRKPGAESE